MFPLKEIKALQALCGTPAEFCKRIGISGPALWGWINREYIPFKYWAKIQAIHPGILTNTMLREMEKRHLATLTRKPPRSNYDLS